MSLSFMSNPLSTVSYRMGHLHISTLKAQITDAPRHLGGGWLGRTLSAKEVSSDRVPAGAQRASCVAESDALSVSTMWVGLSVTKAGDREQINSALRSLKCDTKRQEAD